MGHLVRSRLHLNLLIVAAVVHAKYNAVSFSFCSQEIRYFLEEYNNIEALETSLENSPGDIALWIKLARLKLHQNCDDPHAENNIRQALSTLARALEENAQSEVC